MIHSNDTILSRDVTLQPVHLDSALLKHAILQTLAYADVFDYPLTASEVHRYLTGLRATAQEVTRALDEMAGSCAIARVDRYFTLPGRSSIVDTHDRRAETAANLWQKAARYGQMIASLPFVRMVAVTGSLAMNNTERGQDIDFMLVSAPKRLWVCRALVIGVTRLAKLEGVTLCPNYLVTTNALQFDERSLYVAHEVVQMVPLSGVDIYNTIRSLNAWTDDYLPNAQEASPLHPKVRTARRWQRVVEAVLSLLPIAWLEQWEMQRKIGKLSREQSFSPEAYFSADVCKGHADEHGQQTEALLHERLERLRAL